MTHVSSLGKRMRGKSRALAKLKQKGLSEERLIKAYKAFIRPTAEYVAPAWHSTIITAEQTTELERQQSQSLKNIYSFGINVRRMREKANIELLSTRRRRAGI